MRSFIEFLESTAKPPRDKKMQHPGQFELPDITDVESYGLPPLKGYDSYYSQVYDSIQKERYEGEYKEIWALAETLNKVKALAEQCYSAWILTKSPVKDPGMKHIQKAYPNAEYDEENEIIYNLTEAEIIGGDYPRLRIQDLQISVEKNVIEEYNDYNTKRYKIKIKILRPLMFEIQEQLKEVKQKEEAAIEYAKKMDVLYANAIDILKSTFATSLQSKGHIQDMSRAQY